MSESVVREPRRWGFWFVASLCLNFFLIGVIVMGLIVARNRAALGGLGGGGLRPEVVLQMLPQSGGVKMCEVLRTRLPDFRRLGRDVVEARRAMFRSFRADPFDQASFREALGRLTSAEVAVVREREATIADVVARLTLEERGYFTREIAQRFLSLTKPQGPRKDTGVVLAACKSLGVGAAQ